LIEGYLDKLTASGNRVAIAERVGDSNETKPVRSEEPEPWDDDFGDQTENLVYDEFMGEWVPASDAPEPEPQDSFEDPEEPEEKP
jgi:hypothetical protein